MHALEPLRQTRRPLGRVLLLWFALLLGLSVAAPWRPLGASVLACSATGGVKLIRMADADATAPASGHTLDCPLCLPLGTALPLDLPVAQVTTWAVPAPQPAPLSAHALPTYSPALARAPPVLG